MSEKPNPSMIAVQNNNLPLIKLLIELANPNVILMNDSIMGHTASIYPRLWSYCESPLVNAKLALT